MTAPIQTYQVHLTSRQNCFEPVIPIHAHPLEYKTASVVCSGHCAHIGTPPGDHGLMRPMNPFFKAEAELTFGSTTKFHTSQEIILYKAWAWMPIAKSNTRNKYINGILRQWTGQRNQSAFTLTKN